MPEGFDLQSLLQPFRARELVGQTLSGCTIERLLGKGAMGEAYLARRAADGAAVVVKRVDPSLASDPRVRARLEREWSALSRLRPDPAVVGVHALALDADPPHLVLEYVPGEPLDALVKRRGRLPPLEAARAARDLARGLCAVHEQGLLHRDVKPGNAILRPDGTATLVDFGLAKDTFMTSLTQAGTLMGTAAYMAPELWTGEKVQDPAIDLFALGATLFHLLAGRPPFEGQDVQEIADQVTSGDYPPLAELAPGTPAELARVVDLCLEPERRFRYALASDLLDDLERVLAGRPCRAPCLVDGAGRRWPLVRERRWTLGSDPTCQVVLEGAGPRHAQLRRAEDGFVVVPLQGAATWLGEAALGGPRPLADGDRLRLGAVELRFHEPLRRAAAPALADARRVAVPDPVVRALAARGDARAAAWLLERVAPDPADEARVAARLGALLGPDAARAALERRRAEATELGARARAALSALAGGPPSVEALLAWWVRARGGAPPQLGPTDGDRARRLGVTEPGAPAREVPLDGAGLVLVGQDARCQARLVGPDAPRLLATVVRLHRRFVVRDERAARAGRGDAVRFLDPGAPLDLGAATLHVTASPPSPPPAGRAVPIDPDAFWALEALGHPAVAPALVQLLDEARRGWPWLDAALRAALPDAPPDELTALSEGARALLAARARAARPRLAALLGRDAGDDPAAWRALLATRPAGPPLAPSGWLEATARE